MKPLIKHFGRVKGGRTVFSNQTLYFQQLTQLEGKEFELIIKERSKKPTIDQYGYYRGGILGSCFESEMFAHFDNADQIHSDYFAPKFLSYTVMVTLPTQKYEIVKVRSMTELNRKETSEFIEKVICECGNLEIVILSPEEYYNKYYKNND
jgi:hypothetical protein